MRLSGLIPVVLVLFFSAPAFAQGWIVFVDQEQFFSINFPHEPEVEDITYLSEYGRTLSARFYTTQDNGATYSLTVVDYADTQITDVRGAVAWAAWHIRQRDAEVTFDAYAQIDRIEGHQLQLTNPDQSRTFIGLHVHDRRLYFLEAVVPPRRPPPAMFQVSLSILDQNGDRVRYVVDANGQRERVQPGTGGAQFVPAQEQFTTGAAGGAEGQ